MKKKIVLGIIGLVGLILLSGNFSSAKEERSKTKKNKSSAGEMQSACKSLKYTKIDQETILITEGFSYQKDVALNAPHLMGIKGVKEDHTFIPDEGSVILPGLESAINVTWEFTKPNIVFMRGGCVYRSKGEGATIKFTKEGVLVKNFHISGKTKAKPPRKKTG